MRSVGGCGTPQSGAAAGVGEERPRTVPEVRLALFGKHPAWRDFVAINPSADAQLSAVYEDVYCQCLNALQSGVWGTDLAAVVPHFHHAVARLWPAGDIVAGVLLGSADGLNRHQPLLLAASCPGVCYHRAIGRLLPTVAQLLRQLREVREEQGVIELLGLAAAGFTEDIRRAPEPSATYVAEVLAALLCQPPLAGPGEELDRIVYQLVGHDARVIGGPWESPAGLAERLPVQVRVGIHTPEPAEAIEQWLTFARLLCGCGHPLTLLASLGRTWGDLIAGVPTEAELAAILRLPEGERTAPGEGTEVPEALLNSPEPLTQYVPFSLDEAFRARVSELRREAGAPPPEPIACLAPERSRVQEVTAAAVDIRARCRAALGRISQGLAFWRRSDPS
jgi:hypothetical protein